jgi:nicotinamidase-related amidase
VTPDADTAPNWERAALLTIDVQRDTLTGQPFAVPGTSEILPALRRALVAARRARLPIVHLVRLYLPDASNVDLCRRARVAAGWHPVAPGSPGSELAPDLLPGEGIRLDPGLLLDGSIQPLGYHEMAIYKPRWGAFYRTPLDAQLRHRGVDTLVLGGCNYPNCPRASLFEASERDYRVVLLTDAVSGLDARGCEEMRAIGVHLCTVAELVTALDAGYAALCKVSTS